jgi:hypothetical protein
MIPDAAGLPATWRPETVGDRIEGRLLRIVEPRPAAVRATPRRSLRGRVGGYLQRPTAHLDRDGKVLGVELNEWLATWTRRHPPGTWLRYTYEGLATTALGRTYHRTTGAVLLEPPL